ncbi:MAG: response regulator [Desulfobacteraceae bacterium]|nr:response regulator [Desulfobacteraceae bacterium]
MIQDPSQYTILIVEDEEPVRLSLSSFLQDYEFRIFEAENGIAGLELFRKQQPDLVMLDLRMPGMDGLKLLSILKAEAPDMPAIVVSGTGKIDDAIEALRLGAWDYVLKPISDLKILLHAIEKALERAKLLQENRSYQDNLEQLVHKRTIELENQINERLMAEKDLQKSEQRYRILIDTAREGVWVIDEQACTTFVNKQMADMLGYQVDQMLDRTILDFVDETNKVLLQSKLARRKEGHGEQYDIVFRHKNGSEIYCIVNANPLFDGSGHVVGSFGMITNVTERMRLQNRLQESQRIESIGTLAGGIAHDFNNILSSIFGYTRLMQFDLPEDSPCIEYLENIWAAAERAKNLVHQILTFSRQAEEERICLLLGPIVKETIKFLRASIPSTIEIRESIKESSLKVLADSTQIHQVVMNLCTNAAQSMENKGGVLEITLTDADTNDCGKDAALETLTGPHLRLTVNDSGCGIPLKIIDRIFDPFFTTKKPGKGTGMGLSVVHGIVKSHGGIIRVESSEGKGSKFEVLLPAHNVETVERQAMQEPVLPSGNETVLVVDDETDIVNILIKILTYLGYQVEGKTDSREALELFRSRPSDFDLVITDLTMPDLTGIQFAQKLLEIRADLPVILCTGYDDGITRQQAQSTGIRALLLKPMDAVSLAQTVRTTLDAVRMKFADRQA